MQVKVWFQNRRTKYKRAKADDEHDESPAQSPVSGDRHVERAGAETTHDEYEDDNDDENDSACTDLRVEDDALGRSAAAPLSSEQQLSRSRSPPSSAAAVCRHNGDDRVPPAGCHGDDFRSPLLPPPPPSRHAVPGCPDGAVRKHGSNGTSTAGGSRSKTSHHVNRWRAETNQL